MMLLPRRNLVVWSAPPSRDGFSAPAANAHQADPQVYPDWRAARDRRLDVAGPHAQACWQARKQRCELWRGLAQYSSRSAVRSRSHLRPVPGQRHVRAT